MKVQETEVFLFQISLLLDCLIQWLFRYYLILRHRFCSFAASPLGLYDGCQSCLEHAIVLFPSSSLTHSFWEGTTFFSCRIPPHLHWRRVSGRLSPGEKASEVSLAPKEGPPSNNKKINFKISPSVFTATLFFSFWVTCTSSWTFFYLFFFFLLVFPSNSVPLTFWTSATS